MSVCCFKIGKEIEGVILIVTQSIVKIFFFFFNVRRKLEEKRSDGLCFENKFANCRFLIEKFDIMFNKSREIRK